MNTIERCTRFIGNGVNKEAIQCMDILRPLDEKNHYLMLVSIKNVGLQCYINLFNALFIGVWLSNTNYNIPGDIIIGINEKENKKFKKMSIDEYVKEKYTTPKIQLYTKNNCEIFDCHIESNRQIPLYYKSGMKAMDDISNNSCIKVKDLGNMMNVIRTKVTFKNNLYLKNSKGELIVLKSYIVTQNKL